jgi:Ca-activated chloride channel homolog
MVYWLMTVILAAATTPALSATALSATGRTPVFEESRISRTFNGSFQTIIIENLDGAIEAQVWPSSSVALTASRLGSGNDSRLEAEVLIEQPSPGALKITAKPDARLNPINIFVSVPSTAHLVLRGGKERAVLRGLPASVAVETVSGNVSLYLSDKSNTDLSLRAIQGAINSRLPVSVFGKSDSHLLDGRLGQGGAPVIARSQRGQISLMPDDEAQAAGKVAASFQSPMNESSGPAGKGIANGHQSFDSANQTKQEQSAVADDAGIGHSDQPIVTLSTRLVNLNVKVTDNMGKPLPMLDKSDFQVLEENSPQEISHFEPVSTPLNIVLLLDLSGSAEDKIKIIKQAAKKFVDSLGDQDSIAVAAFTRRFFVISNFTNDKKLLKDRIGDIKNRHSGTAYYDAMWATLNLLDEVKGTRKAIVVMTDGVDNVLDHPDDSDFEPKHSFQELMQRVEEADLTIYPIYLDTEYETVVRRGDGNHEAYATARRQVSELAEQTGGVMFKADRAEDLETAYQQVSAELHSLYSIAYTPKSVSKDGKWRKITITIGRDGAKARTKRGYFAK